MICSNTPILLNTCLHRAANAGQQQVTLHKPGPLPSNVPALYDWLGEFSREISKESRKDGAEANAGRRRTNTGTKVFLDRCNVSRADIRKFQGSLLRREFGINVPDDLGRRELCFEGD